MKTKLLIITSVIMMALGYSASAQVPEKFNYQGIARDNTGAPLANIALGLRISILNSSFAPVYVETHNLTTNAFGLYNIIIGDGTPVTGTMSAINWHTGGKSIKVEVDPTGGTNYIDLGTTELLSVPYALYSPGNGGWSLLGNAAMPGDFIGTTNAEPLRFAFNNIPAGFIEQNNTAFGLNALISNSNEEGYNTAIGKEALYSNTRGDLNTALGSFALYANTTGVANTALGHQALAFNTTGTTNTATGNGALNYNTTGNGNTANGHYALYLNTTGSNNTASGIAALISNTIGEYNTVSGWEVMSGNTSGNYNTATGSRAMYINETGSHNTATGAQALYNNTSNHNVATGYNALFSNTEGVYNVASGSNAMYFNIDGFSNTATGNSSMKSNISGGFNTADGSQALNSNTEGNGNTAVGSLALYDLSGINTDDNTGLGMQTDVADDSSNSTALGHDAYVSGSNMVVIGNSSITSIGGYTNWSNLSDARFKNDMQALEHGLDFIMKLKPITYHYDMQKLHGFMQQREGELEEEEPEWLDKSMDAKAAIQYSGFSAQQVEQAAKSIGYEFSGVHAPQNKNDHYTLAYAEFVVPLVKAVQEQQKMMKAKDKRIENLETQVLAQKELLLQLQKRIGAVEER